MLFYLVLSVMVLFACYHLYRDVKNKINTGNTFAEGMANAGTFDSVEQRYCAKYDSYNRHNVAVSAASPQSSLKANCEKKANDLGHDAYATGKGNARSGPYNCTTYKNCTLSAPGTSASWTRNGAYKYYKKTKPIEPHDKSKTSISWRILPTATYAGGQNTNWNFAPRTVAGPPKTDTNESYNKCKNACENDKNCVGFEWNVIDSRGSCAKIHKWQNPNRPLRVLSNGKPDPRYYGKYKSGVKLTSFNDPKIPEFDNWRKKYFSGSNTKVSNSKPYGSVVADWNECKDTLRTNPEAQQVVFSKSNKACYPMKKMSYQDQDSKGGRNMDWISAQNPPEISDNCALEYCNAETDLKKAFCGGNNCTLDKADTCRKHWFNYGQNENRKKNPIECTKKSKEAKEATQPSNSSTCLQPPPPKVDADKCITPDQLSWGSKIMSMLNGVAGKSKCVDSAAVKKVTETAGPDLILALGAANKHLRQAQPHLQAALKDAQPHLNNALSKSQTHMGSVFVNPVEESQQVANVSGNEVQKVEDNNLPTQNTEASEPQKENTVLETAELPTQGTNSDELNSKIIENNNARPEQQRQKFTDKHFTMPNGNIVLPSKGNCPNGCKAPTYDSESCANQIFMDKEYRNCPWVDEKGNSGSCQGCGAVLLPKNKYGYARTRPGFFSDKTVKNILDQNDFSPKDKKDSVDMGNNLTVGKDFMSELASQKKFNIPRISNAEYQQLGKLVQKYQLAGGDSITNKFNLTNAINSLLNTNPLASNLLENKDDSNNPSGEKTENIPSNQPVDKIVGNSYKKRSINKDDSAQYNTAYTTTYKPVDPNLQPNPYNSLWGSL